MRLWKETIDFVVRTIVPGVTNIIEYVVSILSTGMIMGNYNSSLFKKYSAHKYTHIRTVLVVLW